VRTCLQKRFPRPGGHEAEGGVCVRGGGTDFSPLQRGTEVQRISGMKNSNNMRGKRSYEKDKGIEHGSDGEGEIGGKAFS